MTHSARLKLLPTDDEIEIASLVALSARVGRDPMLVQASNGNTSIKLNGILWIKGYGKWLANAGQEELLVPIQLTEVKESISPTRKSHQAMPARSNYAPPSKRLCMPSCGTVLSSTCTPSTQLPGPYVSMELFRL